MRTDCKHYVRRTGGAGEVVENCGLGAAPNAPYSCPEHCPLFEKVSVSRAGWTLGSLGAPAPGAKANAPSDDDPRTPDAGAVFADLAAEFDRTAVARIEEEERRHRKGKPWWQKRKK